MDSYHNTTNEVTNLREYEDKAKSQEERILAYFRSNWHTTLSPSQVHRYIMQDCPLTSVRRAITNLTNQGLLERTGLKVKGMYGRPEYRWRISHGQGALL